MSGEKRAPKRRNVDAHRRGRFQRRQSPTAAAADKSIVVDRSYESRHTLRRHDARRPHTLQKQRRRWRQRPQQEK